ncbi:phasin family protein [Raineya sp.]|jgi:polyhydroxyalkanoate synthesis regulator phasin
MQDLFKKFIYTGIGFISITAETLKNTVEKLVEESKLSGDEGKKILDEFTKNTEAKKKEFEEQLSKIVEKVTARFKFVTESDLQEVIKRIEVLEGKEPAEKTTKKTVKA